MSRATKKRNREKNIAVMRAVCKRLGISVQAVNETFQFRLRKQNCDRIDYFPTSNKVFFLDAQDWGQIPEDGLEKFLEFQYKK